MEKQPTLAYITVTVIAAVLAVVGAYLPWVQKRPVRYIDGYPYYTAEYVLGLEPGIWGIDPFVIILVGVVVTVVVLARYRTWRPESAVIGAGGLLLIGCGNFFYQYRSGERYVVEPGLYLLVISGLLFVLVGAGTILKRHMTTRTDESREQKSVSSQADSER